MIHPRIVLHNKGSDLFAPMDNFLIILSLYNPKAEDSLDDAMMQSIKIFFGLSSEGSLKKFELGLTKTVFSIGSISMACPQI